MTSYTIKTIFPGSYPFFRLFKKIFSTNWMRARNFVAVFQRGARISRKFSTNQFLYTKSQLQQDYESAITGDQKIEAGFKLSVQADQAKNFQLAKKYLKECYDIAVIQENDMDILQAAWGLTYQSLNLNDIASFELYSKIVIDLIDFDTKDSEEMGVGLKISIDIVDSMCRIGKFDQAGLLLRKAMPLTQNDQEEVQVHELLGKISLEEKNYSSARESFLIALKLAEKLDNRTSIVQIYFDLGVLEHACSETTQALKYLETCAKRADEWKVTSMQTKLKNLIEVIKKTQDLSSK